MKKQRRKKLKETTTFDTVHFINCRCTTVPAIDDNDNVNHPKHYNSHPSGIECITITEWFNFCIGNAIKYLWRADEKNGIEDLKKARWYIDREIARRERGLQGSSGTSR